LLVSDKVGLSPVLQQIAEMIAELKQYNRLIQQFRQTEHVVLRSSSLKDDDNVYT
jgi:hypothetical protein